MGTALFLVCCLHAETGWAQDAAAPGASAPAAAPRPLSGADAADAAEAAAEAKDQILVVGHRQYGAVATETPPEVTLNSAAIRALGAADLDEVFRDIAPEIGDGTVRSARPAGQDGQANQAAAPIVLVNGQRIAGFSAIKDFPPEAVRRIEVFPSTVALQYGYAADQRVVNVVLRTNYHALTLLGRYTAAPSNWRGLYRAKVDFIRIGENSHWNVALDYSHQDPIFDVTTLADPSAPATTVVPQHTLAAQDDHLTISGDATRMLGEVNAELTGRIDLDALQTRPGLSQQDGDLLGSEGLSDLITGPRGRVDRSVDAQTALTLNGKIGTWRWSYVGKLEESTRVTRTGDDLAAEKMDAILLPSPGLLGERCDLGGDADCSSTTLRTAGSDVYLNGNLFVLPAGAVTASFRSGFAFSGIRGYSSFNNPSTQRDRQEGAVQGNLNFPITARDSVLGKLSVGVNGEERRVSDFGSLPTIGTTLEWSPVKPISILASLSRTEQAPSLMQLEEATLDTPDLREYDFNTGVTTIAHRIEGGNDALVHQTSRIAKVRVQVTPFRTADLTLSGEYTLDHTRDPIANLTAATAATMAAFPDHFVRQNGYLTSIDTSPVNLAWRDRQQIRWGLTYSTAFGTPWGGKNGSAPTSRDQFQIALYDTWRLQDDVSLRNGQPTLNLLGTDLISDTGGTSAHQVELQTTISTGPWSADISALWQPSTTVKAGPGLGDELTFSQGITLNLRLQINLADQHWLVSRIPWLRGSLNLSADNLLGAHTTVHDAGGVVPAAYAESYVNPTGRTFRITLRKHFR